MLAVPVPLVSAAYDLLHLPGLQAGLRDLLGITRRIGRVFGGAQDDLIDGQRQRIAGVGGHSDDDARPPHADAGHDVAFEPVERLTVVRPIPIVDKLIGGQLKIGRAKRKSPRGRTAAGAGGTVASCAKQIGIGCGTNLGVVAVEHFHRADIAFVGRESSDNSAGFARGD